MAETKAVEEFIEAKAHVEAVAIESMANCLNHLYYVLDQFSFSGDNRVPELCYWIAHRVLDRPNGDFDGALGLLALAEAIREGTARIDRDGTDVL